MVEDHNRVYPRGQAVLKVDLEALSGVDRKTGTSGKKNIYLPARQQSGLLNPDQNLTS